MTLDPDCVSVRIDNSTASANRRPKIMLVVRSELNSAMWAKMKSRAWWTCWVTEWLTSLSLTFCHSHPPFLSFSPSFSFSLSSSPSLFPPPPASLPLCFKSNNNISVQILIWNFLVFPRATFMVWELML